jgi:hypothetical protein
VESGVRHPHGTGDARENHPGNWLRPSRRYFKLKIVVECRQIIVLAGQGSDQLWENVATTYKFVMPGAVQAPSRP